MALTFPRAMPTEGVAKQTFEIQRVDYASPTLDGRIGGVTAGWPLFAAKWSIGPCDAATAATWRAWVAGQRGSQRLFLGRDLTRGKPRSGTAATITAWSANDDGDVLALTLSAAGAVLSEDDLIGFEWTTDGAPRRFLVRCLETVAADGSGHLSMTVEPPVHAVVPDGASLVLTGPTCLMRLTPDTVLNDQDVVSNLTGTIAALQEILP